MITPAEYWDLCNKHDWTFHFSDDHSKYIKGQLSLAKLQTHYGEHSELSEMFDAFERHFLTEPVAGVPAVDRSPVPERPPNDRLAGQISLL